MFPQHCLSIFLFSKDVFIINRITLSHTSIANKIITNKDKYITYTVFNQYPSHLDKITENILIEIMYPQTPQYLQ